MDSFLVACTGVSEKGSALPPAEENVGDIDSVGTSSISSASRVGLETMVNERLEKYDAKLDVKFREFATNFAIAMKGEIKSLLGDRENNANVDQSLSDRQEVVPPPEPVDQPVSHLRNPQGDGSQPGEDEVGGNLPVT